MFKLILSWIYTLWFMGMGKEHGSVEWDQWNYISPLFIIPVGQSSGISKRGENSWNTEPRTEIYARLTVRICCLRIHWMCHFDECQIEIETAEIRSPVSAVHAGMMGGFHPIHTSPLSSPTSGLRSPINQTCLYAARYTHESLRITRGWRWVSFVYSKNWQATKLH